MTGRAREVLEDCRQALSEIEDGVMGQQWRIRWVAALTLLRSVGYVLDKVDGSRDSLMRQIIKEQRKEPESIIFKEFIKKVRNGIIHEYKLSAGQDVTVRPGTLYLNMKTGEQSSGPSGPRTYSYRINEGYYKGHDQRKVIQEAIDWWEEYLGEIDRKYEGQKESE